MRYLDKTFTLPCASSGVSQEEWDRIFSTELEEHGYELTKKDLRNPALSGSRAEGRKPRTGKSA
jgi:hypothetical protein